MYVLYMYYVCNISGGDENGRYTATEDYKENNIIWFQVSEC